MGKIINSSFSENLINKITDFAFENYISKGADPSRLCFVFGGRRPSLFLRKELAERAGGAMVSPAFFRMEDFLKDIVSQKEELAFMPDIEAAYLIYRLSKEKVPGLLSRRETFAGYLPWAYEILSFINRADMEDVLEDALLNVEANAGIGYDIPEKLNELLKNINIIRKAFHEEVSGRKMMTLGSLYRLAAERVKDFDLSAYDAVIFGNLFYLHRTEETVVKSVYDSGKGVLFFQGDSADWPVLRRMENLFSCEIKTSRDGAPDIKLYSGYDLHSQASIARHIIKDIGSPENSVLILPEPAALMPVITSITSVIDDFNVSLGYPVEKSSLYSLVESMFKAQESRKGKEYYTRDYLGVLLHPLAKNMRLPFDPNVTRTLIHKVEEVLTSDTGSDLCGRLFIAPEDVLGEDRIFSLSAEAGINTGKDELKEILRQFNNFFFKLWEDAKSFRALDTKVREFAEVMTEKSFARYYPLNPKAMETLVETSAELSGASFGSEALPEQDILRILLGRLKEGMVSFPGTPLKGFQVLGLLESRSLNFKNVIVLNANETILPVIKTTEPLIPREVMAGLGINRIDKEEEIQRYELFRLIKGARNVHLVYSAGEKNERSRFIEELLWEKEKHDKHSRLKTAGFGFRAEPSPGKRLFQKTPEVLNYLKAMKYSATSVNVYLDCPAEFYFRYALKVREKEVFTGEPEGSEIGRFIHVFLLKQFARFAGGKPVYDGAFEEGFMNSLGSSFDETFSKRMRSGAFLVKEVVFHRMKRFLEKERERNPRKILALEKDFSGIFKFGNDNYSFGARIDRIDELEDGSNLILDYKTGGPEGIKVRSELPAKVPFSREIIQKYVGSFQLPVYLSLVQKQIKGKVDAALYDLRAAELIEFFNDSEEGPRKQRIEFCLKALEFIVSEINNPVVPFTADNSNTAKCENCPYFYMCR